MPRLLLSSPLVLALLLVATVASAVPTPYLDKAGTSFWFQNLVEDSSTDVGPLFEDPNVVGDALVFTPTLFDSTSTGAASDQTNGTFLFDIVSKDKASIAVETLLLSEFGDYGLSGAGTAATNATALAGVFVTVTEINIGGVLQAPGALDLITLIGLTQDTDTVNFATPTQGGAWNLSVNVDIQSALDSVYGVGTAFATEASVSWNNDLATNSEAGNSSFIQKKVGVPAITVQVIPEPGTALLLGLGLVGLSTVRRR